MPVPKTKPLITAASFRSVPLKANHSFPKLRIATQSSSTDTIRRESSSALAWDNKLERVLGAAAFPNQQQLRLRWVPCTLAAVLSAGVTAAEWLRDPEHLAASPAVARTKAPDSNLVLQVLALASTIYSCRAPKRPVWSELELQSFSKRQFSASSV
jgi:hypothetical protein